MGKQLTPEEKVVLFFALLGLGAGVLLHTTVRSPMLTSCFLAVGVASLVYGFLGGIAGTTFVWGAVKMTGSAAALVSIFWLLDHYLLLERQNLRLEKLVEAPIEGSYEWQWAGEGWLGHITVQSNGVASIKMSNFVTCKGDKKPVLLPLFQQDRAGKAKLSADKVQMTIEIPVRFIHYDGCKSKGPDSDETVLSGTLDRKVSYAGVISYKNKFNETLGDMVLVKDYISSVKLD